MALKDWKKTESNNSIIVYKKTKLEERTLGSKTVKLPINKGTVKIVTMGSFFLVEKFKADSNIPIDGGKPFKTKPQAIKFAKSYMSKN